MYFGGSFAPVDGPLHRHTAVVAPTSVDCLNGTHGLGSVDLLHLDTATSSGSPVGLGGLPTLPASFGLADVMPEQGDLGGDGDVDRADLNILPGAFGSD